MITLIAESKSMGRCRDEVSPEQYLTHRPIFDAIAGSVMDSLAGYTPAQYAADFGVGPKIAANMREFAYDFRDKRTGCAAMDAFTGVVFRSLDYATLDAAARRRASDDVRIISSLYGWLRPADIIKPYRFDFDMKAAPGGVSFIKYWRRDVTLRLVHLIRERGECEVLNLLPMDASKCIDWKLVKRFARVYVPNFKIQSGPEMRTPNATRIKELRGLMLRQVLTEGITRADGLRHMASDHYFYLEDSPYPNQLLFLTA